MMHCKSRIKNSETQHALMKLNEYAFTDLKEISGIKLNKYLELFCEAIRVGAIGELTIDDTTYELYADVVETK